MKRVDDCINSIDEQAKQQKQGVQKEAFLFLPDARQFKPQMPIHGNQHSHWIGMGCLAQRANSVAQESSLTDSG